MGRATKSGLREDGHAGRSGSEGHPVLKARNSH